jgi:6-phosphogluconate dehydrogenase
MIKAGKPVDEVLTQLKPLLEPGDIVIDGGNTHFEETGGARRISKLGHQLRRHGRLGRRGGRAARAFADAGWTRDGLGIAEADPRGDRRQDRLGPCVTHVGPDGAGHFVKMVHNGIEYGDMQLIAEAYDCSPRAWA